MTRHLWFISDPPSDGYKLSRADGGVPLTAHVTVREKEGAIPYDGVWVEGQRSYDTYILLNGTVIMHAPVATVGSKSFEMHEQRGGGHEL